MLSRKRKLLLNTVSAIAYQIVSVICGLIIPVLVLRKFGSDINGLVQSITQFLGIITFLECGIGAVIQSSLYKPLYEKDNYGLSCVLSSGAKFFRKLGFALVIYIIALVFIYPLIQPGFSFFTTTVLIFSIGLSFLCQYFFGAIDGILLSADQLSCIQSISQLISVILNAVLTVLLLNNGFSIEIIKLASAVVFLIKPFAQRVYINKHYSINRNVAYTEEPIKQKWNGVAQHIANVVLNNTDTIVLTTFSTLSNVSIYSVYNLVLSNLKALFVSVVAGVQALLGEIWARGNEKEITSFFNAIELVIHFVVVFVFSCTGLLIVPFISVYTKGVTDANYIQPLFAALITLAYTAYCLQTPYNLLILAAGHYKETQKNYILTAMINLLVSILLVRKCGLIGVAIGTFVAMIFQMIWMAVYDSRILLRRSILCFIKIIVVDILLGVCIFLSTQSIIVEVSSYIEWIVLAIKIAIVVFGELAIAVIMFYRKDLLTIIKWIKRK